MMNDNMMNESNRNDDYLPREVRKDRDYICNRLRLFNYLFKKDILPKETREDYFNPRFKVWIYEPTDELCDAVFEYYNREFYHDYYETKKNTNK